MNLCMLYENIVTEKRSEPHTHTHKRSNRYEGSEFRLARTPETKQRDRDGEAIIHYKYIHSVGIVFLLIALANA